MGTQAPLSAASPALAGGAQAVDRALALLAAVGRAPPEGAPLSALAQAAGVAKPTARRLLISLMGAHLVEQDAGTRAYHLGAGAFLLGLRAGRRHDMAEQAARLAKADLVTGMVGEFPELQGVMGGYYARAEGLDPQVADAIRDHYKPVGQGDDVPTAPVTVAVSPPSPSLKPSLSVMS